VKNGELNIFLNTFKEKYAPEFAIVTGTGLGSMLQVQKFMREYPIRIFQLFLFQLS